MTAVIGQVIIGDTIVIGGFEVDTEAGVPAGIAVEEGDAALLAATGRVECLDLCL